jgi:hypothetical protein
MKNKTFSHLLYKRIVRIYDTIYDSVHDIITSCA